MRLLILWKEFLCTVMSYTTKFDIDNPVALNSYELKLPILMVEITYYIGCILWLGSFSLGCHYTNIHVLFSVWKEIDTIRIINTDQSIHVVSDSQLLCLIEWSTPHTHVVHYSIQLEKIIIPSQKLITLEYNICKACIVC